MKTLTNLKTTVDKNGNVTITGKIVEATFGHPCQQVTVSFSADDNRAWIRQAQLSHEAMFVRHLGAAVAFPLEEWVVSVASKIEPKLNYPPVFAKGRDPLEVTYASELDVTLQWQSADEINGEYVDIPGATKSKLDRESVKGKWVRCKGQNDGGFTTTFPVLVPEDK